MNKALVLESIGTIEYKETPMPDVQDNEVLIRVKAAGICGSDIPRVYKTGAHLMPIIPGHEFSGVVESVGKNVTSAWIGKRVAVFPKIACGKCEQCLKGHPENCTDYDYVGSRRNGAFAEYVTAPVNNLIKLPESVSFEEAAMFEPLAVAANSVRTALGEEEGSDAKIVICGLGTIGFMIAMLLQARGCKNIYLIGNKKSQKDRALSLGIDESNIVITGNEEYGKSEGNASDTVGKIKALTGGGADIYFECVGKNECISQGIEAVSPGGTVILVGNPYSDMFFEKNVYWKILREQITLKGIWNSLYPGDWNYLLSLIEDGRLKPAQLITHRFSLQDAKVGFELMRDKTEDYCKIMILP